MDSIIIRIGFFVGGIGLILFGIWTHSIKKLAVNYAVIWGLLGILMVLMGVIPILSEWTQMLAPGTSGIFSLSISNAAYLSAWKDEWVTLPVDAEEFTRLLDIRKKEEKVADKKVRKEKMTGEYSNRWSVRW